MNSHPTFRWSLATLGAGGILALATAVPATAAQAPGVVLPDPIGTVSVVEVVTPAPFDDDALELIQIGLGALGGIALAGAGAAVMRTRRHHHPQLA